LQAQITAKKAAPSPEKFLAAPGPALELYWFWTVWNRFKIRLVAKNELSACLKLFVGQLAH
jgi:hypothetical protein